MFFNPQSTKEAIDVGFSNKCNKITYPPLLFNNDIVEYSSSDKRQRLET